MSKLYEQDEEEINLDFLEKERDYELSTVQESDHTWKLKIELENARIEAQGNPSFTNLTRLRVARENLRQHSKNEVYSPFQYGEIQQDFSGATPGER